MFFNWNFLLSCDWLLRKSYLSINTCNFLDCINHVNTFKWFVYLDFSSLIDNWTVAFNGSSNVLDNTFQSSPWCPQVCISLVNLDRSELLGLVLASNSLRYGRYVHFAKRSIPPTMERFKLKLGRDAEAPYQCFVHCGGDDERAAAAQPLWRAGVQLKIMSIKVTANFRDDFWTVTKRSKLSRFNQIKGNVTVGVSTSVKP